MRRDAHASAIVKTNIRHLGPREGRFHMSTATVGKRY
jgi:hypothetical protein